MNRDLKRAKTLIPLAYDGGLTDEEYRFLEEAVLRHPELKLELYHHEHLRDLLGMVSNVSAPPDLESKVLERIESEGLVKRAARVLFFPGRRLYVEAIGTVAAAVIVALVAVISLQAPVGIKEDKTTLVYHEPADMTDTSMPAEAETLPTVTEKGRPISEDVAIATDAPRKEKKIDDPFMAIDENTVLKPDELKSSPSVLTPSGMLTAAGCVAAEKVSRVMAPPHDVLISTARKEEPMGSTTFFYSSTEKTLPPTILLIHDNDPDKIKNEIIEKARSLGGTAPTEDRKDVTEKDGDKESSYKGFMKEETVTEAISMPPEKMNELLDYLAVRFPEIGDEVCDLKSRNVSPFLRIDVVPTIQ